MARAYLGSSVRPPPVCGIHSGRSPASAVWPRFRPDAHRLARVGDGQHQWLWFQLRTTFPARSRAPRCAGPAPVRRRCSWREEVRRSPWTDRRPRFQTRRPLDSPRATEYPRVTCRRRRCWRYITHWPNVVVLSRVGFDTPRAGRVAHRARKGVGGSRAPAATAQRPQKQRLQRSTALMRSHDPVFASIGNECSHGPGPLSETGAPYRQGCTLLAQRLEDAHVVGDRRRPC